MKSGTLPEEIDKFIIWVRGSIIRSIYSPQQTSASYQRLQMSLDIKRLQFLVLFASSVTSPTIYCRYANIFVFIDCENNQFQKEMNNDNTDFEFA
jgi:hypothetical protein